MRPAQLSPQCGDNCLIRERLGELHHAAQVFVREATSELGHQLSRHRGDNLLPIGGTFRAQNFVPDALADLPVERGEAKVDGYCGLAPGLDDQTTHIFKERCDRGRGWNEFTHALYSIPSRSLCCFISLRSFVTTACRSSTVGSSSRTGLGSSRVTR